MASMITAIPFNRIGKKALAKMTERYLYVFSYNVISWRSRAHNPGESTPERKVIKSPKPRQRETATVMGAPASSKSRLPSVSSL